MVVKKEKYPDNGVSVSKSTIYAGDEVTVTYNGLLAASGASMVYLHFGYGDEWESKELIPMTNEEGLFKATLKVEFPGILNIAFKDGADNWDNNSSVNYSFKVSKKAAKAEGKTAAAGKTAAKAQTKAEKTVKKEKTAAKKPAAKKPAAKKA